MLLYILYKSSSKYKIVNKLIHFVEYYNITIVLLCVRACVLCVCVCVGIICVAVSTDVLNCIVLYLHLTIMSCCKYAINYSNKTKNIRYFSKRSFISLRSDLLVICMSSVVG